jgi:PAS domain S-box-containing protein
MRWRIAGLVALYALCAGLWIYLSDGIVALLAPNPVPLTQLQTFKGWAFVAVTAALLGLILRHEARARAAREAALRDSEETYRTLVEVESDAIVLIDNATGQLLAANPAAAQLYGYSQAELLGLRNTDLSVEPTETARVTTCTPLTPETIIRIPRRYHRKRDGAVFPVEITGRFFNWRGRAVHLAAIRDITDRQAAEATLARYRLLAAQARDIVLFVHRDSGRILEANEAACTAYGYTSDEMLTLRIQDLRAPETHAAIATQLARADAQGFRFETVHRRKDGTTFPVEVGSVGATLGGDRVLLSIVRDITDRKRADEALRTYRDRLEALLRGSLELARIQPLERLIAGIGEACARLLQADSGDVRIREAHDLVKIVGWGGHEDLGSVARLPIGQGLSGAMAASGAPLIVLDPGADERVHPATRERFRSLGYRAWLGVPIRIGDQLLGTLNMWSRERFSPEDVAIATAFAAQVAIALENTRLFHAESERREQLEVVQAVTAELSRELNLPAALALIARKTFELARADGCGVWLWDAEAEVLVPQAWEGPGWIRDVRLRLGEGVTGEAARRREGLIVNDYLTSPFAHPLWVEREQNRAVIAEPLLSGDRLLGVIGANRNGVGLPFTEEDRRLFRLFADQAAIVIEHARLYTDLKRSYENLRQAQDELVRSEKLRGLGQMAAGIAHDLNNTLATILGQVELLRLRPRSPEVAEGLALLQTAATDGAAVVRRLQDFARQKRAEPLQPCDLTQIVSETLELTRPRWQEEPRRKGIVIDPELDLADVPLIQAHPAELREALTNLIFNAVDAMPQGGTLRLAGRVLPPAEGDPPSAGTEASGLQQPVWVELAVADTGIGIPDAIRGHIFDPFFTTKGLHGTGLGLSVVYGILERHGGRIDVTSVPGQGTTFRLRLRAAASDAQPAVVPHATTAPVSARRILVVDDDAPVRRTLAGLLRASGQDVLEAGGGAEALTCLATTPVDLVFTDLGMPEVTGWDVARAAKARCAHLPVVLLTGWGVQVATEAPSGVTVDRVLPKPVARRTILALIAELTGPR